MGLPEEFTEEMRELLGEEFSAWMKSFEKGETGSFRGLRVNTRKTVSRSIWNEGIRMPKNRLGNWRG